MEITSVFPPTTVAATTALLSGKYPKETGWLGWSQYFNQIDRTIDMFSGRDSFKATIKLEPNPSYTYNSYESIIQILNNTEGVTATQIMPSSIIPGNINSLNQFMSAISKEMSKKGRHFTYAYWTDPDSTIHEYGVDHVYTHNIIREINKEVAKLIKENKNGLVILLADHGLIDTEPLYLDEHEDLYELLIDDCYLDARANFYRIKDFEKNGTKFKTLFEKYYGEHFKLYTREEVIANNIFGLGNEHPTFKNFVGDFLSIGITNKSVICPKKDNDFILIGHHSGGTEEERMVSISIFNK